MSRVVVHIESLVLRGVAHEDRHRVAEGLRAELGRRLSDPDVARAWATAAVARAPRAIRVPVASDARPGETGAAVARGLVSTPGARPAGGRGARS